MAQTCGATITTHLESAPHLIRTHLLHQSSEGAGEGEGEERKREGGQNGAHVGVEMNYNEPFEMEGKEKSKSVFPTFVPLRNEEMLGCVEAHVPSWDPDLRRP